MANGKTRLHGPMGLERQIEILEETLADLEE